MTWQKYSRGTERAVYSDTQEKHLLKISHDTKENDSESEDRETLPELMARFYVTRLFHILYPNFIPNIHFIAETNSPLGINGTRTVEISQKIEVVAEELPIKDLYERFMKLKPQEVMQAKKLEAEKMK